MNNSYDVVVVGGGAAGLSGAIALARSRRSVLLVDAGDPRNSVAGHVHNFLTRDGEPPAALHARGRAELESFDGEVHSGRVTRLERETDGFRVIVDDQVITARRVLVATGLTDELPDLPGLAQRWGIDVLHCPFCHGWEVRDQRIGILATGPMAMHQAVLFGQLSPHVTVLAHSGPVPTEDQLDELTALGIGIVDGEVTAVEAAEAGLTGVRLADGTLIELDALVVAPRLTTRSELLAPLGLEPVPLMFGEHLVGSRIEAGATGETAVPGLFVAGNVTDLHAQVITSAAAGLGAGAAIHRDLMMTDTAQAVADLRYEREFGLAAWEDRYRAKEQAWSGRPNAALVTEVSELTPGIALDAGSGEGGDAIWLAEQGWTVTGAELSTTAIERASRRADQLGLSITWEQVDLLEEPVRGTYDLVSAFFLHLPEGRRQTVFGRLAAAVAPGGTLLVVGHDPSDAHTSMHRHHLTEMGWTAPELAEWLGDGWSIETSEARQRRAVDPEGNEITIHDAIVRARRRE